MRAGRHGCSAPDASSKIDLKIKNIIRYKKGHYIMIKRSIQEEDITIVNIYAPNIGASQYENKIRKGFYCYEGSQVRAPLHPRPGLTHTTPGPPCPAHLQSTNGATCTHIPQCVQPLNTRFPGDINLFMKTR